MKIINFHYLKKDGLFYIWWVINKRACVGEEVGVEGEMKGGKMK